MKTNRRLRVRVTFIIFYFELAPTDLWCNMLQTLLGRTKYEEEMSDEQPRKVRTSYNDSKPTLDAILYKMCFIMNHNWTKL